MSETATYEIVDRFLEPGECNGLLYAPVAGNLTYRDTRRYSIDYEGERAAVDSFVTETLLDQVSQDLHAGEDPALSLSGCKFFLDYGMKPGALDLEKEAIASYFFGLEDPGFQLKGLKVERRIYVFGNGEADAGLFVRDICNPAIHTWTITDG